MIRLEKLEGVLLISFLLFFCYSLLYIFRAFDNNTLVSWKWIFGDQGFTVILPYLVLCIGLSFLFSFCLSLENSQPIILAILSTVAVLPLWSEPELILDSGRYFMQAKNLSEYGVVFFLKEWGHSITAWTDMPLVPFLYGLMLKLSNESRMAIQFFNTIIFALTVVITSRIGSILWNKELGFYAGLILAGMPYLLSQVPQMLVDVPAMFFLVLALYCFLKALRQTNYTSLLLSSVTIILAMFTKYSLWPLLTLFPLAGLLFHSQHSSYKHTFKRMLLIFLPSVLVSVPLYSLKIDVFTEQLTILVSYQRPALRLWGEGMLTSLLFHCHPFFIVLALISFFKALRLKDKRFAIILLFCSLIIILQIKRIRYMVPLLPFFALMMSYGLTAFTEKTIRKFTACIIVSSSLAILYVLYLPFFQTTSMMNIKMAGEFLDQLETQSVQVTVFPQERSEGSSFIAVPLLDLFTKKRIVLAQEWPQVKPEGLSDHSPLLFTWLTKKPAYYTSQDVSYPPGAVAIISSAVSASENLWPLDNSPKKQTLASFTKSSEVFRYQTFVSVFN